MSHIPFDQLMSIVVPSETVLDRIWYVPFGVHQKIARQTNNPLIESAAGRRRQFPSGRIRNVYADHGEIAVVEHPNLEDVIKQARTAVKVKKK